MREAIFLLAVASANGGIALRLLEPMLPELAAEFGISVSAASTVITAFAIGYAGGTLAYGPLGDRFGKLRVVTLSLFGAAAGSFGCALAPDVAWLAAARFVTAMLASASVTLGMAYIGDRVPLGERQPVIARFVGGTIIGQALGPAFGGLMTDLVTWRGTFVFLGAVFLAVATLLAVRTRSQWAGDGRPGTGNPYTIHLRLMAISRVRYVVAAALIDAFFFFGAYSFLGAFLKLKFDLSLTLIGAILAGFGIGGVLYTLMVGPLLRSLGQGGLVAWGGAICCAAFALIVLTPAWPLAIACTTVLGFAFYMLHNTVQVKATEMAPQARGAGVSIYAASWSFAQGLGVAAMGITVGAWGYVPGIIAFGLGFFALGLWLRANLARLS